MAWRWDSEECSNNPDVNLIKVERMREREREREKKKKKERMNE